MIELPVIAAIFVAYTFISHRVESYVSGPLIFMTLGIVISEQALGLFRLDLDSLTIQVLLKGSLALVLFTEASALRMRGLSTAVLPARLLLVAMPLVMIGGLVAAGLLFGVLTFWEAAVVGVLLAPTDAALGLPVVENKRVPERIRNGLVVESGLNDGLAVPFALFAAGVAEVNLGTRTRPDRGTGCTRVWSFANSLATSTGTMSVRVESS